MNWLERFFGRRSISYQDVWGQGLDVFTTTSAASGERVTTDSALGVSTAWACIGLISDDVSTVPVDSFIRSEGVRRPYRPRPTWLDFATGPWRKIDVLGQVGVSLLIEGNAYLATYRDPTGRIVWIDVLDPNRVEPKRVSTTEIRCSIDGGEPLSALDVLPIRGMTLPGEIKGCSPVEYHRETLGLSIAATKHGGAFFGNGAVPGAIAEVPGQMSETGIKTMKEAWNEVHRGAGNSHRLAVLTEGAKFQKISIPPDDAQFLQTREFQVEDVARIYRVLPAHVGHFRGPEVGNSLQEKNVYLTQHTLRPWVERLEGALTWLLVSEGVNQRSFIKLNLDGLQRGDYDTRWSTYIAAVTAGLMTINEARAKEDMPPVKWGNEPISVQVQPDAVEPPPTDPPEEGD